MQNINPQFIDITRRYLIANKGGWRTISAETGISYEWLCKFVQGRFKEPGVIKVEKLLIYAGLISNSDAGHIIKSVTDYVP